MSAPERRAKPISVYLSPRAATILREYNRGSGYGSTSRTVEEIILAFDAVYKNMQTFSNFAKVRLDADLSQKQRAEYFLGLVAVLLNISNALSRLQPEGTLTSYVKAQEG